MEGITDLHYKSLTTHAKRVWKEFRLQNLGQDHGLYVQSDTLLVVGNLWTRSCSEVELKLLKDADMFLMVERGIRSGIWYAAHWYAKASNKYMKDYVQNTELPCLMYCNVSNLCTQTMQQELPVNDFRWKERISEFTEKLIQDYDHDVDVG